MKQDWRTRLSVDASSCIHPVILSIFYGVYREFRTHSQVGDVAHQAQAPLDEPERQAGHDPLGGTAADQLVQPAELQAART